jgi:YrbI family 3-deoxy-D-manno-octulosonate 8-phosphate phosphatase
MIGKGTIALIPARGGSVGIVKKNIRHLRGKPVMAYAIEAALQSGVVDQVYVSTDDVEIAEVAQKYGAEVVWETNPEDEKPIIEYDLSKDSYLRIGLHRIREMGLEPEDIIFIQCTSPLTTAKDINQAYTKYKEGEYDSLLSVTPQAGGFKCGGFVWDKDGNSLNYDYKNRKRRQELPEHYLENGAFYIFTADGLTEHQNRLYGKIGQHVMPALRSFELDEPEDWEILEYLFDKVYAKEAKIAEVVSNIKLLILDFDGVLTDNKVLVREDGTESVVCNRGDGMGLELLRKHTNIKVRIISKETNLVVSARCKKLNIECVQSTENKKTALNDIMQEMGVSKEEVAYIGNDLNDLQVRESVGTFIAVADAYPEVKKIADYITTKDGGDGAVREICDALIKDKQNA